jgi:hypothetical protein
MRAEIIEVSGENSTERAITPWRFIGMVACLVVCTLCVPVFEAQAGEIRESYSQHYSLPEDPEPVLRRVLADDEFRERPLESLWEHLWDRFVEVVSRAIEWLQRRLSGRSGIKVNLEAASIALEYFLLGFGALTAAVVAFYLARFILSRRGRPSAAPLPHPQEADAIHLSSEAYQRADAEAGRGNYGTALIFLFRALLLWLDEHGRIRLHPGRTNREILLDLSPGEPARDLLHSLIPAFNRVKFGDIPCKQDEYEAFLASSRRLTETRSHDHEK